MEASRPTREVQVTRRMGYKLELSVLGQPLPARYLYPAKLGGEPIWPATWSPCISRWTTGPMGGIYVSVSV